MNTVELVREQDTEYELVELQLRIARRADELARSTRESGTRSPWDLWLAAEREILGEAPVDRRGSASVG